MVEKWSASSWGCELKYQCVDKLVCKCRSASSWGCELKYALNVYADLYGLVSLFVRLWVEMRSQQKQPDRLWSASSWGCELKWTWSEVRMMAKFVSLFVRLWVEIVVISAVSVAGGSASSWGCELKCPWGIHALRLSQSASSWGCELKCVWPLLGCSLDTSASSWGCELKYTEIGIFDEYIGQPLREAVSWNISITLEVPGRLVSLFVRLWVEIKIHITIEFIFMSASSWGCELKCRYAGICTGKQ